ncbi:NUDIX domain-containing protein [Nannocystis bainbridge]|uniref:NUDIX domain-containing protein n=1 Tax=Nannocystis bainbridge TaxID=2995303 RepID=A0ABT5DTT3_9BACT|nr:NUDIX domain-containing protein [Nannocystis bainbridge]MDC0717053.1 NUDIX domain-containing protein [Nannocystis bainbridge]
MPRPAVPSYYFALVVVRRADRFLVVHEVKHGQLWYLPAGRVEQGEALLEGAAREVLEETGIPVALTGVLRIEHTAHAEMTRVRVFFTAEPVDDRPPKSHADEHSLEARWVTLAELRALPLRGEEVEELFAAVERGLPVHPLSLITSEGAPWR